MVLRHFAACAMPRCHMEPENFRKDPGCFVHMTTNNWILGNEILDSVLSHPVGIPKYNLRGINGILYLLFLPSLFLPPWVILFRSHVQVCVSSPDSVMGSISQGPWSLPAGVPPNVPVFLYLPGSLQLGQAVNPRSG